MRFFVLLSFLSALSCYAAGPIEFGAKVGLPLTHVLKSSDNPSTLIDTETRRYLFGPTVELKLPFRLSIEADALYQRFSFHSGLIRNPGSVLAATSDASVNQWEFPIMAKYKFNGGRVRPYVAAGASFRHISDVSRLSNFVSGTNPGNDTGTGFVAAGGVQLNLFLVKISPELRFTQWGANSFADGFGNILKTTRSQGEVMVGITF